MGDYAEAFHLTDDRLDLKQMDVVSTDEQYENVSKLLFPIREKIVCLLAGNHDYRLYMRSGHDYCEWLGKELDVPYCGYDAYVRFHFSRVNAGKDSLHRTAFNLYAHHGWSSARTDGAVVKSIQDMHNIFPGCHLYLMGHTHRLGEALPKTWLYVNNGGKVQEFMERFVFTGSYYKGYEIGEGSSYVESRGLPPTSLGSPIVEVKVNRSDGHHYSSQKPPFNLRVSNVGFENGDE